MLSEFRLRFCQHLLQHQGVIAYPTESVFGLGCNPLSEIAVERILKLKSRPVEKGLILVASSLDQLEAYTRLNDSMRERILSTDSPTTWLVKKSDYTPTWISGQHQKVAVRISPHPVVQQLCRFLDHPLVSTSANPSGAEPAHTVLHARRYFGRLIDAYIPGRTGMIRQATPIIDIETDRIIRA